MGRPPDLNNIRWRLGAVGVIAAAAIVQALYYCHVKRSGPVLSAPMGDSGVYLKLAAELRQGGEAARAVFYWSPLYPVLIALLGRTVLVGVQVVAGIAVLVLVGLLAARLCNWRAGFLAVFLAASYWLPPVYHHRLVPVTLATTACALAVYLLALPSRWYTLVPAGLSFGLSGLLMPQLLLAPACAVAILSLRRAPQWRNALLLACGVVIAVLPVAVRNWVVGRDFIPLSSSGGFNFYIGNNANAVGGISRPPEMGEFRVGNRELVTVAEQEEFQRLFAEHDVGRPLRPSDVSRFWLRRGVAWIARNPGRACWLWVRKLLLGLASYELADSYYPELERRITWPLRLLPIGFGFLFGAGVVGIFLASRYWGTDKSGALEVDNCGHALIKDRLTIQLLLAVPPAVLVSLVTFFVNGRFRLPAFPVLAVFGGIGLDMVAGWVCRGVRLRRRDSGVKRGMVVLACMGLIWGSSSLVLPAVFNEVVVFDELYGLVNFSKTEQAVGNLAAAGKLLGRAEMLANGRRSDDLARTFVELGNRYLDRRDFVEAARAYDRAMTYDPGYAPAFMMRGVVAFFGGNEEQALSYADEAIRRDPQLANAWVLRGRTLLALRRNAEARDAAVKALKLDSTSLLARELAGALGLTLLGP